MYASDVVISFSAMKHPNRRAVIKLGYNMFSQELFVSKGSYDRQFWLLHVIFDLLSY